jgi:hypothetical protein
MCFVWDGFYRGEKGGRKTSEENNIVIQVGSNVGLDLCEGVVV